MNSPQPPARVHVSIDVDEDRIRAIVREEIAASAPAPLSTGTETAAAAPAFKGWATPPEAARLLSNHVGRHIALSRVQGWIEAGRVRRRAKNANAPKQKKWEVLLQDVLAAYEDEEARPRPQLVRGG